MVSEYVDGYLAARKAPGGVAISVSGPAGELWSKGFGLADPASGRPFTPDTISNIGSVSKLVTATAIMKLAEAGKVTLDAPLTSYIPELAPRSRSPDLRPVTIRDIMTQHSGLPSDYLDGLISGSRPADYPETFLRDVGYVSRSFAARAPGKAYAYSNLAVSLLGVVVERVSGTSFPDFCRREIFEPLNMGSSSFVMPEGFESDERYARGLVDGKPVSIPYFRDLPAGGLVTTAHDLAKFASSFLAAYKGGRGILAPETVREMLRPQNADVAQDLGFLIGLNFMLFPVPASSELAVGHTGGLPPFQGLLLMLPERGIAVSILANSMSYNLAKMADQVLRAAISAEGQAPLVPKVRPQAVATPLGADTKFTGFYASEILGLFKIERAAGGIKVTIGDQTYYGQLRNDNSVALERRSLFKRETISNLVLRPFDVEGRCALALDMGFALPLLRADRVEKSPLPEAWMKRSGDYVLSPGQATSLATIPSFSIGIDKASGLFVEKRDNGKFLIPLRAVSDTECTIVGGYRRGGETLEAVGDELLFEGLHFSRPQQGSSHAVDSRRVRDGR